MNTITHAILWIGLCLSCVGAYCQEKAFTYGTPEGVRLTVTPEGLSRIHGRGKQVAQGHWKAAGADAMFGPRKTGLLDNAPETHDFKRIDDAHASVRHVYPRVTVNYEYEFSGEDLSITARIHNEHPDKDIEAVRFGGLNFRFGQEPPGGIYRTFSDRELNRLKAGACHPSRHMPVGGTATIGKTFGVGVAPIRHGLSPALVNWSAGGGRHDRPRPEMTLQYYVPQTVWAEGARTFRLRLRISPRTGWKHLLAPYRQTFNETFGEARYKPSPRPLVHVTHPSSYRAVGGNNLYGFNDQKRRFDRRKNVAHFIETKLPRIKQWGAQGVVFTGMAGLDKRGIGYRPDFRLLPPEVQHNLPLLQAAFEEAGLRMGVSGQPNAFGVRKSWHLSEILPLSAEKESQLNHMWRFRIKTWRSRGASLFYFVNFGGNLNDIRALRYFRGKLGGTVTVVSQHCSDVLLLDANGSIALNYNPKQKTFSPGMSHSTRQALKWLVPEATLFARAGNKAEKAAPDAFMGKVEELGWTPMIPEIALDTALTK